jgi:hypothetical protein
MFRFHTLQTPHFVPVPAFQRGNEVFLAKGSYQGTVGTFLNFKDDDPNWADILEPKCQVRSHPVEWLAHAPRDQR